MDDETTRLNKTLTGLVNELGEEQLLELNRLIIERIKAIRAQRKATSMSSFSVGDEVVFPDKQGEQVSATVLRLNIMKMFSSRSSVKIHHVIVKQVEQG